MPSTVVLELPFLYRVTYVAPKKRNPETSVVKGYAPFEINVATDAEAPVTTVWVQEANHRKFSRKPDAEPHVVTTRSFDGRSFLPLSGSEGEDLEDFLAGARAPRPRWNEPTRSTAWGSFDLPSSPILRSGAYGHEKDYRNFISETEVLASAARGFKTQARKQGDDREACLAEAVAKWTSGLLVVDGRVWGSDDPRREAHYEVGRWAKEGAPLGDGQREVRITVSLKPAKEGMHGVSFRADRRGDAVAFAHALAESTGCEVRDEGDVIETPNPSRLVLDQAVMLADLLSTRARTSCVNRADFETWNEGMEGAEERLEALREAPRGPEWAGQVMAAFGGFRRAADALGIEGKDNAQQMLKAGEPAWLAWDLFERHNRPELVSEEEDVAALTSGM